VVVREQARKTPVIDTRRGSIPEVVTDGETGFVCDDVDEMVKAVGRIGTLSREACRRRCKDHFSAQAIVDAYQQLYVRHASGR
jgi:glycosyltransferase involved in cell wall biosynthesis